MNIIELAREAQQENLTDTSGYWFQMEVRDLERFAALVRAQALEEAAGVCDGVAVQANEAWHMGYKTQDQGREIGADACAAAIRQLKDKP